MIFTHFADTLREREPHTPLSFYPGGTPIDFDYVHNWQSIALNRLDVTELNEPLIGHWTNIEISCITSDSAILLISIGFRYAVCSAFCWHIVEMFDRFELHVSQWAYYLSTPEQFKSSTIQIATSTENIV